MKQEQKKLFKRERMVVEIDPEIVRLAKSLAAIRGQALWQFVEEAMRKQIANNTSVGGK